MLAPGLPVPGASWEGATSCGAKRLRVCADASGGMAQTKAAAVTTQHQILVGPHPAMAAFFDSNRGNFKPVRRPLAPSPYSLLRLGGLYRAADHARCGYPAWGRAMLETFPGVKRLTTA
jgi:hypothetical protein